MNNNYPNHPNDANEWETKDWEDATFSCLKRYFQEKNFAHHQLSSFDFFIHHRLARIIEEDPMIEIALPKNEMYRVIFGQAFVDRPYIVDEKRIVRYITPNEARLRDLTYSSMVSVNMKTYRIRKEGNEEIILEQREYTKLPLARLPIMVYSSKCNLYQKPLPQRWEAGECQHDYGGYFIIKGKERVLVAQERINYNMVYVFEPKVNSKFPFVAEIRSMSEETGHSVLLQMKYHYSEHKIVLSLPYLTHDVSLGWVFRAFDCPFEMVRHWILANLPISLQTHHTTQLWLRRLYKEMQACGSTQEAVEMMAHLSSCAVSKEKRMAFITQILHNEMLPHLGISSTLAQKVSFLTHMYSRLLLVFLKQRPFDDRDHLANKRIEVGGILLAELFRTLYKRFLRTLEPQLQKRQDVALAMTRVNVITQGLKHCFATGNWGIPKSSYMRTGVSQVLSRLTYMATLSHLRRILIPIGKEGKNTKIRQLHPSQLGFFCPSETPEGHSAGIVKNFSLLCEISPKFDPIYLRVILESFPEIETDFDKWSSFCFTSTKIFYNGIWYGWIQSDARTFFERMQDMKIQHRFHYTTSISWEESLREIHFFADEGRLLRPLWNARNMPSLDQLRHASWDTLLMQGHLMWVDPHEMENRVVAYSPFQLVRSFHPTKEEIKRKDMYDNCEIHASLLMGVCVSLIPYPEHTQSPRLCYVASMSKQALGIYAGNHHFRTDTMTYLIDSPEQPIVRTHYSEFSGYNELPCGNNLIVAIACYTGFNQEDSVIFNRSSLERGVFRTTGYKTIVVEEKKRTSHYMESIALVPEEYRTRSYNYDKLRPDGIIEPGVFVGIGDVLVSRMIHRPSKHGRDIQETSHVVKAGEEGYIDKVFVSVSPDGYKMIKIKIRQNKFPEIGDKVCSRCSQKGTIGMIYAQEDMPFTTQGIVPDLIMNPHAIPSRMTMNQLLECIGAKSAVHRGHFRYSTAFTSHSQNIVDELTTSLHQCGFQPYGHERMFNGITGEMMDANIFIGPTYYHRLKHLVSGKIHARNHGNVQMLFRQPCEGRSKEGGLRFGEMERDAMISHGASRFLVERLFDMSDPFQIPVCIQCGLMTSNDQTCDYCLIQNQHSMTSPSSTSSTHTKHLKQIKSSTSSVEENVVIRSTVQSVPLPYACKLLFQELMALGIRIQIRLDSTTNTKMLRIVPPS